ncbi:hypothetical protein RchiOBHm_Chr2g0135671 [Rosa chinensis]|uniref:Uncharacterized protein n=1 Tax=Rosa chinensis TaxID=74649 RepID=A0A2P6RW52_ROSCH|nr:hypothetical protein RchiOBHm_Chr2g0135671 [Rosa chinensis]
MNRSSIKSGWKVRRILPSMFIEKSQQSGQRRNLGEDVRSFYSGRSPSRIVLVFP